MQPIDFDTRFSDALNLWIEQNKNRYKRPEAMEEAAADYYLSWLEQPADWLGGVAPGAYFQSVHDAAALVDLLREHILQEVPVPDPLLDWLVELHQDAPLLALALDADAPCEARMHAIDLLRQLESAAPMVEYLRWQVERNQDDDLLDNALESLRCMGEPVRRPAKIAFLAANDAGKEALLDVLADYPGDEDVFRFALEQFKTTKDKRALYAGYLAKLDDDHALEALLDVAEGDDVTYTDFIEIRSAIERLGSEAPVRDWTHDPTYQAFKRLQRAQN